MTAHGAEFLPGLDLSGVLYGEAVRPLLAEAYPGLRYAAARVGAGSEVLGYDTARSADHDWGPRLQVFVAPDDAARHGTAIHRLLAERLPKRIRGWSTHFRQSEDPTDPVGQMTDTDGPVSHRIEILDVDGWLTAQLGPGAADPSGPVTVDWLTMPQQRLAEVTGGAVFHDGTGDLTAARRRLAWYPEQVWRYLLACQWQRISQEEAFVGRCAEVGDELGAAVVAGRLVRDLMRLCLLLDRRYAPYSKWLGSAFTRLPVAARLTPSLRGALAASDQPTRERCLCEAYSVVGARQNDTGLAAPVDPTPRPYFSRPFQVVDAGRFARALAATVTDPALRDRPLTGGIDQWADNTDFLGLPRAAAAEHLAPSPSPGTAPGTAVSPAG
ncbi:MAG: DUF4037 domain-containing protein [Actinocatenispora sp.]